MSATFDPKAVAEFQFAGQDIPWLLNHWAEHKPEHDFLVWEPKEGGERRWTYAQSNEAARSVAAGLRPRG